MKPNLFWPRAAAWGIRHFKLSAILIMLATVLAPLPVAYLIWMELLTGAVKEAEMRGRSKAVVIELSTVDKRCLEWREESGAWRCIRR